LCQTWKNGRAETGNRSRRLGIYLKSWSVPFLCRVVRAGKDGKVQVAMLPQPLDGDCDPSRQARIGQKRPPGLMKAKKSAPFLSQKLKLD